MPIAAAAMGRRTTRRFEKKKKNNKILFALPIHSDCTFFNLSLLRAPLEKLAITQDCHLPPPSLATNDKLDGGTDG